jgi:hypothetical protein
VNELSCTRYVPNARNKHVSESSHPQPFSLQWSFARALDNNGDIGDYVNCYEGREFDRNHRSRYADSMAPRLVRAEPNHHIRRHRAKKEPLLTDEEAENTIEQCGHSPLGHLV